jgi:hypothetical protein
VTRSALDPARRWANAGSPGRRCRFKYWKFVLLKYSEIHAIKVRHEPRAEE